MGPRMGNELVAEMFDLLSEHSNHLVDALSAIQAGAPKAAEISLANAELILIDMEGKMNAASD